MTTNEKIKKLRKANSLTQNQFAKSIGISRSNLTNIELGNVKPTMLLIKCISSIYGVDSEFLLNDSVDELRFNKITELHKELINGYDKLNETNSQIVNSLINALLEIQNKCSDN